MGLNTELPPLPDAAILLAERARDWRGAVEAAGRALNASGATDAGYGTDMVRMIEEHGPYVVIAPGLALAHARPRIISSFSACSS